MDYQTMIKSAHDLIEDQTMSVIDKCNFLHVVVNVYHHEQFLSQFEDYRSQLLTPIQSKLDSAESLSDAEKIFVRDQIQ